MSNRWTRMEQKILLDMFADREEDEDIWVKIAEELPDRTAEACRMWYRNNVGETGRFVDVVEDVSLAPRIALFDVETLPMVCYTWRIYKPFISPEMVINETCFLSWAGKFINYPDIHSDILTPDEARERDGRRIAQSCWDFINNVDILIGHNLDKFDMPVVNTFFLKAGLPPLKPMLIDSLKIVRKHFAFSSNKMGAVNRALGLQEKLDNDGFPLWKRCSNGEQDALAEMLSYNQQDVLALEDLYYKIRPYISIKKFNVALYSELEEQLCPICGHDKFSIEGNYITAVGRWQTYRCKNCTAVFRGRENLLSKNKKAQLLHPFNA